MVQAAVYVRVSTEEQARGGVSLDMQEERCRQRALGDGAEEVAVYRDEGYSGTTTNRPALQEMMGNLEDFDVIYVWKLDRLSRSLRDTANIVASLAEAKVGLASVTEAFDFGSPMGRAMLGMLAVFAELFVGILKENVRAAQRQIAETGRSPNKPPFGYDVPRDGNGDSQKGAWVIVPGEAEEIRGAFRAYAQGATLHQIAMDWNTRQVPHRQTGEVWRLGHIGKILRNQAYLGMFRWGDELYEGAHEAIVDGATWNVVQERLRQRSQRNVGRTGASLSSIFSCGVCGGPIRQDGAAKGYKYYTCGRSRELPAVQRHEYVGVGAGKANAVLWAVVRDVLKSEDAWLAALDRWVQQEQEASGREQVMLRLAQVEETIRYNLEAFESEAIPVALLAEKNKPLMAERDRLREELEEPRGAGQLDPDALRQLRVLATTTIDRLADGGDVGVQLEVLGKLLRTVEVGADSILTFHFQDDVLPSVRYELPGYYAPRRGSQFAVIDLDQLRVCNT